MDIRNNLFGNRGGGGGGLPGRPSGGGGQPPPSRYDSPSSRGYGAPPSQGQYQQRNSGYGKVPPSTTGYPSGGGGGGRPVRLRLAKVDDKALQQRYIFTNICAVSPRDFPPSPDGADTYLRLYGNSVEGDYVVTARPTPGFPDGCIALSDPQRTWMRVAIVDEVIGEVYNPFNNGQQAYLGTIDAEVGFASSKKFTDAPYDQDVLAEQMTKTLANQVLAPGQRLLLDVQSIPLSIVIKTVKLADLSMKPDSNGPEVRTDPGARGILLPQTIINFYKSASSPIQLSGSNRRQTANAIIAPDFKFEELGIGGLDSEFSTIFRRAFASRLLPPGFMEKVGIQHVKGLLLYGPPGTGKTLIAREIGKMLNAREPKIINGPEVLNKYVGQSEENIRKLFADAEKEQKEKGNESGLHVIIFDELDAVCKQRGSGAGGGTGVGDSVVNQLLSKLDGVNQLNNILLIGMTNRKDMIDDALLRPGRLEVQVEISLPDKDGRLQILKIHTAKMKANDILDATVDLGDLAARTKNFSGAEIAGLARSATSFAMNRSIKFDNTVVISDDINDAKVTMTDFENALAEIKPAFGTADETLEQNLEHGIIHYSPHTKAVVQKCLQYAANVRGPNLRHLSVLLYGPEGSGTTALAAHIAMQSGYPFVRIVSPMDMMSYNTEIGRKEYLHKVYTDACKSRLSLLILDGIEDLTEYNPLGPRMSNVMTLAINTIISAVPPKGHKLLILATTSRRSALDQMGITTRFQYKMAVPAVADLRELGNVLNGTGRLPPASINHVLHMLQQNNGHDRVGVGIKPVLAVAFAQDTVQDTSESAGTAQLGGEAWVESFVEDMGKMIGENQVFENQPQI